MLRLTLSVGSLSLALQLGQPEPESGPHEVLFVNPDEDTDLARGFLQGLHDDLGSYDQ